MYWRNVKQNTEFERKNSTYAIPGVSTIIYLYLI
jgi:hypothetical protein